MNPSIIQHPSICSSFHPSSLSLLIHPLSDIIRSSPLNHPKILHRSSSIFPLLIHPTIHPTGYGAVCSALPSSTSSSFSLLGAPRWSSAQMGSAVLHAPWDLLTTGGGSPKGPASVRCLRFTQRNTVSTSKLPQDLSLSQSDPICPLEEKKKASVSSLKLQFQELNVHLL